MWLFAALCAWSLWVNVKGGMDMAAALEYTSLPGAFLDGDLLWTRGVPTVICAVLLICALICAPGLTKGAAGARIFGVVWSIGAVLLVGYMFTFLVIDYLQHRDFIPPWVSNPYPMAFARHAALQVLAIVILVLMFVPGVRRWTPSRSAAVVVMMAPPGAQAPQGHMPQQPYPPRY